MAAKIKKGDYVIVISGKDKGKKGKVLKVIYDEKTRKPVRVVVEGVNIVVRHQRYVSETKPYGKVKKEAPIHISNVMLIDPKTGEPTRVGFKWVDGKKVRYAKKSGEVID